MKTCETSLGKTSFNFFQATVPLKRINFKYSFQQHAVPNIDLLVRSHKKDTRIIGFFTFCFSHVNFFGFNEFASKISEH
jgi:hypothetical protein